jgi:hypothetical protein
VLFEFIRALAAILAAVAALVGLFLGVTRAARVRRREQLFRESLTALAEDDPRRKIVYELHRAALADLIARQLTSSWRTSWPWVAWFIVIAVFGQVGYETADYLAGDAPWSFYDYLLAVTGDPITAILMLPIMLGLVPRIHKGHLLTLEGRAKVARSFYVGESIERPVTLGQLMIMNEIEALAAGSAKSSREIAEEVSWRQVRAALAAWRRSVVPGLFCASVGILAGSNLWLQQQPGDRLQAVESMGGFFFLSLLSLSLFGISAATVWANVVMDLRRLAVPSRHPESPIVRPGQTS